MQCKSGLSLFKEYMLLSSSLARLDFPTGKGYDSSILFFGGTIYHVLNHSKGVAKR